MAKTNRGRELTENHRIAQATLAERLVNWVIEVVLRLFKISDIDDSAIRIAEEIVPRILQYRAVSEHLSENYMIDFRDAEVPKRNRQPIDFGTDTYQPSEAVHQVIVSIRATAKIAVKQSLTSNEVTQRTAKAVAAKAQKIAQDGGRRAIIHDVEHGKGPIGYARVLDSKPCAFCAMLASRGVSYTGFLPDGTGLYRSDAFKAANSRFIGDGKFKVHDYCGCTLEPVYERAGKIRLPGIGDRLAWEWAEIAAGQPDSFKAWRRWWDSKTLPDDYEGALESEGVKRPKKKKKKTNPWVASPIVGFTKDDYLKQVADLQKRLEGVEKEIAVMKAHGAADRDVNLFSLKHQRKVLLSRIESYKKHAASM